MTVRALKCVSFVPAVGDKLGLMDGQNLKFATSQVLRHGWSRGEKDVAAKRAAAAVTAVHARPRGMCMFLLNYIWRFVYFINIGL